jgi:hypothetical protein
MMASRDNSDQPRRGNSNQAGSWGLGIGAVALGAVAAVGGYLLGKTKAEEQAELDQLKHNHQRGFLPSTPKKSPKRTQADAGSSNATGAEAVAGNNDVVKDQDGSQECAICLRSFQELNKLEEEIHTTPCGHVFCYTCISQSLPARSKCPICNTYVKPGQTMRLFL